LGLAWGREREREREGVGVEVGLEVGVEVGLEVGLKVGVEVGLEVGLEVGVSEYEARRERGREKATSSKHSPTRHSASLCEIDCLSLSACPCLYCCTLTQSPRLASRAAARSSRSVA